MTGKEGLIRQAIGFQEAINRLILEYKTEKWLSLDLTIAQLKSILYISSEGKANFRELASALEVSPSVVTGIVDRLISQGLVVRVANPEDRRMQWLTITEKGKKTLDNIRQESIKEISQILEELSHEELGALVKGMAALIKAAEPYLENRQRLTDSPATDEI